MQVGINFKPESSSFQKKKQPILRKKTSRGGGVRNVYAALLRAVLHWKNYSAELAKINTAIYYVKLMRALRIFFLSTLMVALGLIFTVLGLLMLHILLLHFLPCSALAKIWFAIVLSILDIGISVTIFWNICSEKYWLKITQTDDVIDKVLPS